MLLKLPEPKLLTESIFIISELVTEVNMKVTKEGLEIIAVDPANVALVSLKLSAKAFSQYEVDKEDALGLNLEDFKQVLKRIPVGSSLAIEKDGNRLKLTILDKVKRNFNLALINIDQDEKQMPDLTFTNNILINSTNFSEAVNDSAVVADACSFITLKKENKFIVEAKGSLNQAKSEFSSDEAEMTIEDSKSRYSLEYLLKFIKASKFTEKIRIRFSTNYPARFDFKSGTFLELDFVLAPRVEED